jgi:hypothetical protein
VTYNEMHCNLVCNREYSDTLIAFDNAHNTLHYLADLSAYQYISVRLARSVDFGG